MIKGKLYASERVRNTHRKFGSAADWTAAYLIEEDGIAVPLLLSDDQIEVARQRAEANPEDVRAAAPEEDEGRVFVAMVLAGVFGLGVALGLAL